MQCAWQISAIRGAAETKLGEICGCEVTRDKLSLTNEGSLPKRHNSCENTSMLFFRARLYINVGPEFLNGSLSMIHVFVCQFIAPPFIITRIIYFSKYGAIQAIEFDSGATVRMFMESSMYTVKALISIISIFQSATARSIHSIGGFRT
jgi:hypothetical protein